MDYIKLVRDIIEPIVLYPEALKIEIIPNEKKESFIQILVTSKSEDTARLIGKGGSVANAIRKVVSIKSRLDNLHIKVSV